LSTSTVRYETVPKVVARPPWLEDPPDQAQPPLDDPPDMGTHDPDYLTTADYSTTPRPYIDAEAMENRVNTYA
jgi:hypothetical protein